MPISNHVHLAVSLDHSSVPQAPLVVIKVSFLIHPLVCDLNLETLTASFGSVKIKGPRHSKPFERGPIPQTQVFKLMVLQLSAFVGSAWGGTLVMAQLPTRQGDLAKVLRGLG